MIGTELPVQEVPITRTLIVATALATRDFQPVHHDPEIARERGSRDVFMNILTSNGLVERFVVDWAGPRAVVERIRIRLGAPNYPGDTMRMSGHVVAAEGSTVTVEVRGENSLGAHVTGTVTLRLDQEER